MRHWLTTQIGKFIEYSGNTVHDMEFRKSGDLRARINKAQWIVDQFIKTLTLGINKVY